MSNLTQITDSIDDNVRDKLPLVEKVELADTLQLITDEMFPDSVKVQWNVTAPIDPITDIVCNPSLPSLGKCKFTIYFTKYGNRVFYKGIFVNSENSISIGGSAFTLVLCTFPTTLYKPLANHYSLSNLQLFNGAPTILQNAFIQVEAGGVALRGSVPASINDFSFEGSYKVVN